MTGLAQGEDVDGGGFTVLTSPVLDASNPDAVLVFDLFMDNGVGTDGMVINASDDGGNRFNTLQVYRPLNDGVWIHNEWIIADLNVDNTDEFMIQFKIADQGSDHPVEVAIDGFKIRNGLLCDESCEGDADGDNDVDFDDLLAVLSAYGGPCDDCPEDLDGDNDVDFDDLLIVLANFGSGC